MKCSPGTRVFIAVVGHTRVRLFEDLECEFGKANPCGFRQSVRPNRQSEASDRQEIRYRTESEIDVVTATYRCDLYPFARPFADCVPFDFKTHALRANRCTEQAPTGYPLCVAADLVFDTTGVACLRKDRDSVHKPFVGPTGNRRDLMPGHIETLPEDCFAARSHRGGEVSSASPS